MHCGTHVHQAQNRVEQVVMGGRLAGALGQARHVQSAGLDKAWAEPHHHRHALLHLWRNRVGDAVQEEVVLAERLTMVGHVDDGGVHAVGLRLQALDQRGHQVVGVEQGVVVGVDDLLSGAQAQVVLLAGRLEPREGRRMAPEVRRTMVAQLVQEQHLCPFRLGQAFVQIMQQAFIQAAPTLAQAGRVPVLDEGGGQPIAHPLAAGLVVHPLHAHAGTGQHVQQRLAAADALLVIGPAAHGREHAGQRHLGVGAAARHLGKVDQAGRGGELWRGLPRIARQAPVRRAGGLTHDEDQHQRPRALGEVRAWGGVQPDGLARRCGALGVSRQHAADGPEVVGRGDQVAQFLLIAHERREGLEDRQDGAHDHGQRREQGACAHQQGAGPASGLQPQPPEHQQGQGGLPQQVRQQGPAEQFAGFLGVGAQHIAQHGRVEVDAKAVHEVASKRRAHDQQRGQGLEGVAHAHRRHQQKVQRQHHQGQRYSEAPGAGIAPLTSLERGTQEGAVGRQQPEQAQRQCGGFG